MKFRKLSLILIVFALVLPVIVNPAKAEDGGKSSYFPTDGWRTSTPEEQGMDSAQLADLLEDFVAEDGGLDSLLVIRNGYVVLDAYVYPVEVGDRHELYSVTKSMTSTMIGVAIQQGYIESVDQPVVDLLGDLVPEGVDDEHAALTLEDMLMMGSGIDCPGDEGSNPMATISFRMEGDRFEEILLEPLVAAPGERFQYCNPVSNLLSVIITQTTGKNAYELGTEYVFEPLGMRQPIWTSDSRGNSLGYAQMQMSPYDMAKIGYLYLNDGMWDGVQILPSDYVKRATSRQIDALAIGYGYQWWVINEDIAFAWGYNGQHIIINRDLNMIIVTTASNAVEFIPAYHNLTDRVFGSVSDDEALLANEIDNARLQDAIEVLGNPKTVADDLMTHIDGQEFALPENDLGWQTVRISTTDASDVLSISIDGSPNVPLNMTSASASVSANLADWLPGNGEVILSGDWSAPDTLHINGQVFVPPGGFEVWFTFGDEGVTGITIFDK